MQVFCIVYIELYVRYYSWIRQQDSSEQNEQR